jgi:hypothetical protein
MFIENYRLENIVGGQGLMTVPYTEILAEDWKAWQAFLPVEIEHKITDRLITSLPVPTRAAQQIVEADRHFDAIEIWGKRSLYKDPIAVGLLDGRRYLICRWGVDRPLPFEIIKQRSGKYRAWNMLLSTMDNGVFAPVAAVLTIWGSVLIWIILFAGE